MLGFIKQMLAIFCLHSFFSWNILYRVAAQKYILMELHMGFSFPQQYFVQLFYSSSSVHVTVLIAQRRTGCDTLSDLVKKQ